MREVKLALVGFGNVGQAFVRLLLRKGSQLEMDEGLVFSVSGIATRSRGVLIDPNGIPLADVLARLARDEPLVDSTSSRSIDVIDFINSVDAGVMLENTPVSPLDGEPAISHVRAALERGMHVVTANKGPVAHGYRQLTELARQRDVSFLFESAVMDGAPIFSLFREALPGAQLLGFYGILNSSTNLLLGRMEAGETFEEALAYARSVGIVETDPSADVDGWDAAIKVCCLANVLMGVDLKPQDIDREGMGGITPAMIAQARQSGARWKLVCHAQLEKGSVTGQVRPEMVTPESPLFAISGTSSFVQFQTDVLPGLGVLESDPGPETTAYGLLADILNIYRER
ncbi:MAG: homoserine dehydrogenase [Anaerolineae bacterium]|nr:homoserine dehydrogenase [Anaerolineae bacterium]